MGDLRRRDPVRLLIVDDDDVFRSSLRYLLEGDDRIDVVGVAHDVESALAAAGDGADAVLVDVLLRGSRGFEVVAALRAHHERIALLMMSGLDASEYEREAAQAGADGIVTKGSFVSDGSEGLVRAVTAALGRSV
jgi:DNA-binding NarL/FixJ family response regulator